jgi:hypothetical protein
LRALATAALPARRRWSASEAQAVLQRLAASGLSVREFAARTDLTVQRLYRWRGRLGSSPGQGPTFVEIRPSAYASASIEVVLRSGHVLRVPHGFDDEVVRRLVKILDEEESRC